MIDRKKLRDQYVSTPRPMGVFQVRNLRDGRLLVGSSVDLPSRFNRERTQLGFGGHPNRALQRDWATLGAASFAFEIVDTLEPPEHAPQYDPRDDLATLEAMWIERLQPFDERGYNTRPRVRT